MLGISYKSAWFMCHRLREAMRPAKYPRPLGGLEETVEDETFVGDKAANRKNRKVRAKQAVVVLVHRGADARSFPIRKVNSRHMNALLDKQVSKKSYLMTDESRVYSRLGKKFCDHETVNHSIEEYVRGDAHVNNAENYFSILKRGIYGVYHHVSHEHLPMYLAEFDFRYNARAGLGVNDYERARTCGQGHCRQTPHLSTASCREAGKRNLKNRSGASWSGEIDSSKRPTNTRLNGERTRLRIMSSQCPCRLGATTDIFPELSAAVMAPKSGQWLIP
jgi:hypothetical protein